MVSADGFVVVGKPNCPWCDRVKALLDAHEKPYVYLDLSDRGDILEWLVANGVKTVPQVFYDGMRVGGFEQTELFVKALNL